MRHTSDSMAVDHVALAILQSQDHLILVQQQHLATTTPYWVVPGGLVEAGELVIDALHREVREEAGVQIEDLPRLVCISQIDRPQHQAQTVVFMFVAAAWSGSLSVADPDNEVIHAALVPRAEAIERLRRNGGWPGIQEPLRAYLQGNVAMGSMWFYRDTGNGQQFVGRV